MKQTDNCSFSIRKEDMTKGLELLKKLSKKASLKWIDRDDLFNSKILSEALFVCGWHPKTDQDGNINNIWFANELLGSELKIFNAIAPVVQDGSFIEMEGEEGHLWRWVFEDKHCKEELPTVIWEYESR